MGKNKRKGHGKTIAFLILLLAAGLFIAFRMGVFTVTKVEYTPNVNVSDKDIFEYSGLADNDNWFTIQQKAMADRMQSHPFVKSVTVQKKLPNRVIMDIAYREEFAALVYAGLYITVDDELVALRLQDGVGDSFVIEGFAFDSFNIGEEVKVVERRQLMRTVQLISLLKQSHIEAKPHIRYDGGIVLLINDEFKALFGDGKDIEAKFKGFVTVYDKLTETGVQSGVIDVSHSGLPSYRPFGD